MTQIQGFKDSANIRIKNGSVYYFTIGDTYLSRFKNSLRLEDKFKNDDAFEDMLINVVNVEREKVLKRFEAEEPKPIKTYDESVSHDYDGYKFSLRKSRVSKKMRNLKKRENCNTKKNKIKQNGYDEKLNNIRLSIPPVVALRVDDPLFNYDDWDDYWIGNDKYEDTSDNLYNENNSTTSSEDEEYAFECAVEYARHMINR
jgi:hypothetical protein